MAASTLTAFRTTIVKTMQTSLKKVYFQFPECSLSFAKIIKGKRNSKAVKQSFTKLDIAEPHLIICKDNANRMQNKINENLSFIYFFMLRCSLYYKNIRQIACRTKYNQLFFTTSGSMILTFRKAIKTHCIGIKMHTP